MSFTGFMLFEKGAKNADYNWQNANVSSLVFPVT